MSAESTDRPVPTDDDAVIVDRSELVTTITLNRPAALNAMTVGLLEGLVRALRSSAGDRAVLLRGAGRAFCVGEDLKQSLAPATGEVDELRASFDLLQETTRLMTGMAAPVVAAVHGYAVGGGIELAVAADFVVVEHGTRIRFPEVAIGHAPTGGVTARLPQLIGLMRAKELLYTGRWVDAEEAVRLGLALEAARDAAARGAELAASLALLPRRPLAATKRSLELGAVANQEAAMRLEVEAATHCFTAADAEETFAQFRADKTVAGAR
jgi:enoyl-CoA hydratase/carnithine racemase